MENNKGAYYLLILTHTDGKQLEFEYDNAEAARKHAKYDMASNPDGLRHLFKMLPNHDPIEVMV
jgi:hypothetical protein